MRPIVTDGLRRSSVVCRSVTIVSPAKTAEPIQMPFGLWTRVGPRKHACIRQGCTLAPPGEYNWTVHVLQRCVLSAKLLWPLIKMHWLEVTLSRMRGRGMLQSLRGTAGDGRMNWSGSVVAKLHWRRNDFSSRRQVGSWWVAVQLGWLMANCSTPVKRRQAMPGRPRLIVGRGGTVKPRLHDTTSCETGWTTVFTTGL